MEDRIWDARKSPSAGDDDDDIGGDDDGHIGEMMLGYDGDGGDGDDDGGDDDTG